MATITVYLLSPQDQDRVIAGVKVNKGSWSDCMREVPKDCAKLVKAGKLKVGEKQVDDVTWKKI